MDWYIDRNSSHIGDDRTLPDGVLWDWLHLASVFEYISETNGLDLWSPSAQQKLDQIISKPTFSEDSFNFCTELTRNVNDAINDGFDYENYYDLDTFRAWSYAERYIEELVKCVSEEYLL